MMYWWLFLVFCTSRTSASELLFTNINILPSDNDNENETDVFETAQNFYGDFESQLIFAHMHICKSSCNVSDIKRPGLENKKLCDKCSCDHLCYVYDDCCPDILFTNMSITMPSDFGATWDETKIMSQETDRFTCEPATVGMDSSDFVHYRMVNYCPSIEFSDTLSNLFGPLSQITNNNFTENQQSIANWQDLQAKCKNIENSTHWNFTRPVTSSNGIVFRNKYCAQCHGQLAQNLIKWNLTLDCDGDELLTFTSAEDAYHAAAAMKTNSCRVHFLYENIDKGQSCRRFTPPAITSCSQSGFGRDHYWWLESACASHTNVVGKRYKNVFCFYCNFDMTVEEAISKLYLMYGHAEVARVSFYALLAFDGDGYNAIASSTESRNEVVISQEEKCQGDTILDPSTCQCRAVRCGPTFVFKGNDCISYITSSNYCSFNVCAQFRFTSETPITSVPRIFTELQTQFASDDFHVLEVKIIPRLDCENSGALTVDMNSMIYSPRMLDLQSIAQIIVSVHHKVAQSWSSDTSMNVTVIVPAPNCLEESEWLNSIPDDCSTKNRTRSLDMKIRGDIGLQEMRHENIRHFALQNTTFCPHVILTKEEFRNYSARLHDVGLSERNITSDVVIQKNETFYLVCMKDYHRILSLSTCQTKIQVPSSDGFQDSWTTLGLLSVLCTCISLLSLLCVIVTYSLLRPLRTTMGTSTLSMACLLFLAQILYEVGIEQFEIYEVCLLLAVLIHFFWLAAVFMMSSCTLQLFYSVVFPLQARAFLASKVLKISLSCSFGLSMVIISLVMLGNQLMYGDLGYPHRYLCFIRRSLFRQLGFGLPLGLAVVLNIVVFIVTTVHTRRLPDISCTRENKVSLVACFRLSMITGLTWLSLFLLSVPGTRPWLEYVSVLLLGLQGLLLATTLLINKRVFSLWTDFFHHRNKRLSINH